jgi:hypothetical protein
MLFLFMANGLRLFEQLKALWKDCRYETKYCTVLEGFHFFYSANKKGLNRSKMLSVGFSKGQAGRVFWQLSSGAFFHFAYRN